MVRRRLIWQLYPSYLLITLLSMLAVTVYGSRSLRSFFLRQTQSNLESRAELLMHEMHRQLDTGSPAALDSLVKVQGRRSDTRITVILPGGRVIADSERDPSTMDNHLHRPEIQQALRRDAPGSSSRYSNTLDEMMMYVAMPLYRGDELRAVVRTSMPIDSIDHALGTIYRHIGWAWLVIAALAAWLSWVNARRIAHPLEEMRRRAKRIAAGDLGGRLPTTGTEEVAALADAMNHMTAQLEERIITILRQRREQKAVFSSISDGVLAVDADGLLISINRAAANLFGVDRKQVRGRTIQEVFENPDLRYFISQTLSTGGEIESEIVLPGVDERYLQAHGRPLMDETGNSMGAVVVLNDVTRLRRLEKTRRDFVANVSHELRTPVTSIKGFVETLRDGALDNPTDARRFIDIIGRQAQRLDAIIEDLLSLARIERDAEGEDIHLQVEALRPAVEGAITVVSPHAEKRSIDLHVDVPAEVKAWINPPLLEQAVVNLVDNAIKYSGEGTTVTIRAREHDREVVIEVQDQGMGIDPEHLPRIFERFYRVDKGRSRAVGGTGLGLAIVKHIALAHGGRVSVESVPGESSTFILHLIPSHRSLPSTEKPSPA